MPKGIAERSYCASSRNYAGNSRRNPPLDPQVFAKIEIMESRVRGKIGQRPEHGIAVPLIESPRLIFDRRQIAVAAPVRDGDLFSLPKQPAAKSMASQVFW